MGGLNPQQRIPSHPLSKNFGFTPLEKNPNSQNFTLPKKQYLKLFNKMSAMHSLKKNEQVAKCPCPHNNKKMQTLQTKNRQCPCLRKNNNHKNNTTEKQQLQNNKTTCSVNMHGPTIQKGRRVELILVSRWSFNRSTRACDSRR